MMDLGDRPEMLMTTDDGPRGRPEMLTTTDDGFRGQAGNADDDR